MEDTGAWRGCLCGAGRNAPSGSKSRGGNRRLGGVRKVRFVLPGGGKSGSVHVIYVDIMVDETIYMLYAYPKSVKENLSKAEIAEFKKLVDLLKR